MEWFLFSKFSWFLVLTTLSQRLSGYFTSLWYLALNQASKFAVYGLLALSSSPHLSLLCPVSPVDCAAPTPVLTAFIRRGLPTGRHRHEKPRTVPQPPCLGRCLRGSCTSFWLQFPLDSSSFWRVVSALGLQKNDLIFLPRDGSGAMIYFWIAPPFPDGLLALLLNSFYLKYKWVALFWDGWWQIFPVDYVFSLYTPWCLAQWLDTASAK